MTMVDEN